MSLSPTEWGVASRAKNHLLGLASQGGPEIASPRSKPAEFRCRLSFVIPPSVEYKRVSYQGVPLQMKSRPGCQPNAHLQTSSETHLLSGDNGSKSLITLPSGRQLQTRPLGVANHFRDFCLLDSCWQQPRAGAQRAESHVAGLLAKGPTRPNPPSMRDLESGDQDNQLPTAHGYSTRKATLVTHGAPEHKGGHHRESGRKQSSAIALFT